MNKRILITGGAGFIGSALCVRLLNHGYHIRVLDNLSPQIHGSDPKKSYTFNLIKDKADFIQADVTNREVLKQAVKDVDYIVHLAAETGTGQSNYLITDYVRTNSLGTATLLDVLVNNNHNVKKIIFASSRAIYGEGKYYCKEHGLVYPQSRNILDMSNGIYDCLCPVCKTSLTLMPTDETTPPSPKSVYGITKLNQEHLIALVCSSIRIPSIALRFQNVYGPGQSLNNPYTGILAIFSNLMKKNKQIEVFEDGHESRDFVFIDDVTESLIKSLVYEGDLMNMAINIGSGSRISVLEMSKILKKEISSVSKIKISGKYRIGDIRHNVADISLAKEILNYTPKINFEQGIKKFSMWVKTQEQTNTLFQSSLFELEKRGLLKK